MSVNSTNPKNLFGGTWVAWGTGRVPVGIDTSQTEFNAVEKTGGEKTHELTIAELAKHTHTYQRTIYNTGTNGFLSQDGKAGIGGSYTTGETGESKPHNNLQPYITCYMWKRTA